MDEEGERRKEGRGGQDRYGASGVTDCLPTGYSRRRRERASPEDEAAREEGKVAHEIPAGASGRLRGKRRASSRSYTPATAGKAEKAAKGRSGRFVRDNGRFAPRA